jgi:hypothetical protein
VEPEDENAMCSRSETELTPVRKAYLILARETHPDRGAETAAFQQLLRELTAGEQVLPPILTLSLSR